MRYLCCVLCGAWCVVQHLHLALSVLRARRLVLDLIRQRALVLALFLGSRVKVLLIHLEFVIRDFRV